MSATATLDKAESLPRDAAELSLSLDGETPVFCFSASALEKRARTFLNGFKGEVSFAVKSNPSRQVISALAHAGVSAWDVASVPEIELVHSIQRKGHIHYHNPVKSLREITRAYKEFGVRRFVV